MKTDLHPQYHKDIKITCSCGNVIIAGSTKEDLKTEICSACHPFYTGQQKLVDTAGRVDKYMERVKKAQKIKEKQVKKVDEDLDEMFEEETPTEAEKQDQGTAELADVAVETKAVEEEAEKDEKVKDEEVIEKTEAEAKPEKKTAKKTPAKKATKKTTAKSKKEDK